MGCGVDSGVAVGGGALVSATRAATGAASCTLVPVPGEAAGGGAGCAGRELMCEHYTSGDRAWRLLLGRGSVAMRCAIVPVPREAAGGGAR